jgi:YVTN family beta-propeller protein
MDRIYVANQGNIGAGPPSVTVLHRPSRSIVATIPLPGPGRQVDVNTSAGEMYVTTDRGDVQVIDTVSLMVTRVIPTHSAPWAIAAAKGTVQQVFVGDRFDGSVIRIS